ncbi:CapA family protein [Actinomadura sp. NPDC048955]|uniref:CapA family protein n=1 Tax=Actinomadura sp. NPDC048955 TaxID=3158228 RepID=UPI0033C4DDC6
MSPSTPRSSNGRQPGGSRLAACTLLIAALGLGALSACDGVHRRSATLQRATKAVRHKPVQFTVAATGDFLLHRVVMDQAASDARTEGRDGYDFTPMLARLNPVVSGADLGICHIETPLASRSGPFLGYPSFNSPPAIVNAIRGLGYDTCSTASNHAIDQGEPGVRRTLAALDGAGIRHAGTARSAEEAKKINLLDVKGLKIAHLSYTYGTNGIAKPAGRPWLVNDGLDAGRILADAANAKKSGADAVMVSLHWGEEYQHEATPEQRHLAAKLLRSSDVNLILGDHVHVVQPFERINGKWVVYGMGNQVANPTANTPATHRGLVALFTFTWDSREQRWREQPSFVPTLVSPGPPIRLRTLVRGDATDQAAIDDTTRVVRSLGFDIPDASDQVTSMKLQSPERN